jgi:hypothetical protein
VCACVILCACVRACACVCVYPVPPVTHSPCLTAAQSLLSAQYHTLYPLSHTVHVSLPLSPPCLPNIISCTPCHILSMSHCRSVPPVCPISYPVPPATYCPCLTAAQSLLSAQYHTLYPLPHTVHVSLPLSPPCLPNIISSPHSQERALIKIQSFFCRTQFPVAAVSVGSEPTAPCDRTRLSPDLPSEGPWGRAMPARRAPTIQETPYGRRCSLAEEGV